MATNFQVNGSNFEDNFIRRDLFSQGGLWLWGRNNYGQLGDNTSGAGTNKSSPVQTVAGGTNWKQMSVGQLVGQSAAGIKTDGTLWTWGYNNTGSLGDNTSGAGTNKSSPIQTIAGGTNWKQVEVNVAIKTDGTLWSWGYNNYGQLGDNTVTSKSSPVQTVAGGTNWKQVSTQESAHVAAIKTDGTLWLWGYNNYGILGDNTTSYKSSPVQTVSGGTNWKQVSVGSNTAAIKTDGTLWTWGSNFHGQLGNNTTNDASSPIQTIASGTNWKSISVGSLFMAAIKTDGTLWLWGKNDYGQLGDNTTVKKSSPVQTVAGGTNWKQVGRTAAIKTDGTLWLWGKNTYGRLGDNTTTHKSSPVQTVAGGTNWKLVNSGNYSTIAITDIF
jgi:alpha-tubulin suppressor-like RCC1 family protein